MKNVQSQGKAALLEIIQENSSRGWALRGGLKNCREKHRKAILESLPWLWDISLLCGQGSYLGVFMTSQGKSDLVFPGEGERRGGAGALAPGAGADRDLHLGQPAGGITVLGSEVKKKQGLLQGICEAFDMYIPKEMRPRNGKAPPPFGKISQIRISTGELVTSTEFLSTFPSPLTSQ